MSKLTSYIAVALLATSSFNIARAGTAGDVRSEIVRFADLDINKSPGTEILYRRLNIAANKVCRELDPGGSLALVSPHRACVHSALSKALADVGNPAVLAYAASHGTAVANVTLHVAQSK